MFACVLGTAWFWFVGATFLQLLPTFTRDVLGGGPRVVTVMLTAFSIGIGDRVFGVFRSLERTD